MMEGKTLAPKPKERWTEFDKAASNFNSKDLTTILSAVDLDQFKIIQGCKSANWKTISGLIICLEYGAVCSNTSLGFVSKTWEHECNWNQVDFKNKTDEMEMWSEINQDWLLKVNIKWKSLMLMKTFLSGKAWVYSFIIEIACLLKINLNQMDVKSTFLTRVLQEELYVAQPKNLNIHTILTI